MATGDKCFLILLVMLMNTHTFSHATKYQNVHKHNKKNEKGNRDSRTTMHNVTIDCGDYGALGITVATCQRELLHFASNSSLWSGRDIETKIRSNQSARNGSVDISDSLDLLDHMCYIHERSRMCLKENGVCDYCLNTANALLVETDSQFICQQQRRDENLIHALQCLHDTRVLAMLFFHIGNHCLRGMDILDDLMMRMKHQYFYTLNVNRTLEMPHIATPLYCLPTHVISSCVKDIIEDYCGRRCSELVENYLLYYQERYGIAFKSAGLSSNICQYKTSSKCTLAAPPTVNSDTYKDLGFTRGLKMAAPGTALDTVMGRSLVAEMFNLSGREICTNELHTFVAYTGCFLSSDDKCESSKFNILQFGQALIPVIYHGTQCLRLEQFTACWNQLQNMCGSKVRGFKQHATLLVESCNIQSEMDTAGCHWQDMLLGHYIKASRVTIWPLVFQGLKNPLFLESGQSKPNKVRKDLHTAISFLQLGVDEISKKCGQKPAKRLQSVLHKLQYLQFDALKTMFQIYNMDQN